MPSQISHLIFGEQAISRALKQEAETLLKHYGNIFRFGCQGPDFFYHNQRTRPMGLKYALSVHKEGYGRLVKNLLIEALHLRDQDIDREEYDRLSAYLLGFSTHAFLDRQTHPFISYYSGWVETGQEKTKKYYRCHAFFERIIDVLLLKIIKKQDIREYNAPSLLNCGKMLPYPIIKTLMKGLHAAYPQMHYKSRDRKRIENAYIDTMYFYEITDPLNQKYRQMALDRDLNPGSNRRRLALFHPLDIRADIDFLNIKKKTWFHPCKKNVKSRASFLELYEQALNRSVSVLEYIWAVLKEKEDPEPLERLIGNESLNTGLDASEDCMFKHSSPLPLSEMIDDLYSELAPCL